MILTTAIFYRDWIGWPSHFVAGTTAHDLLLRTPLLEQVRYIT